VRDGWFVELMHVLCADSLCTVPVLSRPYSAMRSCQRNGTFDVVVARAVCISRCASRRREEVKLMADRIYNMRVGKCVCAL
jgi:hypothetical protein